jgi:hypothetical protein
MGLGHRRRSLDQPSIYRQEGLLRWTRLPARAVCEETAMRGGISGHWGGALPLSAD